MPQYNRRKFMQMSAAGLAIGAGSSMLANPFFRRALYAADCDLNPEKKMLIIFQRGGNDGLHTVIPHGDSQYNTTLRPSLFVSPTEAIDLNGFASLHPSLAKLEGLFLEDKLAVMHRMGYTGQSRSHFSSQHYWENAEPGNLGNLEGWANRLIQEGTPPDAPFPGASVSNQFQRLFQGDAILAHIRDLRSYSLGGSQADVKLLGALPGGGSSGSGVLGVYSLPEDGTVWSGTIRETGLALGENLDHLLCRGVNPLTYVPEAGATYPTSSEPEEFTSGNSFTFFRQLRDAVQLLKETDVRVVGVELNGFDTHSNQGTLSGGHPQLLNTLAHGIRSASIDLQGPTNIWNDSLVVTLTEFGRTSEENDSNGTDHGESTVMFAAGGAVNGLVHNCDTTTWADGDVKSTPNERYVSHRTDFRAVLAETVERHFGLTDVAQLNAIIPGWSGLSGSTYDYVNFL